MSLQRRIFVITNVNLSPNASFKEAFSVTDAKLKKMGVRATGISYSIFRKSVDARKKNDVKIVYSVAAEGEFSESDAKRLQREGISELTNEEPEFLIRGEQIEAPPVVVGTGPCGLFAALVLAEHGYKPVVIERGSCVGERKKAVSFSFVRHRT